jgi:asparagine synthase (glutamine-hydrolysing)
MFHAIPENLTLLSGIRKLNPGTIVTISLNGEIKEETYWKLKVQSSIIHKKQNEERWIHELSQILYKAIKRQSVADVPVGLLLSGGLDSSLIAAILAQVNEKKLRTFSIGFESSIDEAGDEFFYSDIIAKEFGSEHTKIHINNDELFKTLDDCIFEMSEPMTSHDNPAFFLLSKEVSKHVKVVQSGQGADEIFAGYHWFQQFIKIPKKTDPIRFYAKHVLDRPYTEYYQAVMPAYRTIDFSQIVIEKSFRENDSTSLVENALCFDSEFPLSEGPLKRIDNMTMAWSLESRVPFLDHELVEFAASMPISLKTLQGGKYILKKLAESLLPKEIINRPKGYFPVPVLRKLQSKYINRIREVLSPKQVIKRGVFNPDYVFKLLTSPHEHMTPLNGSKLWQIAVLEMWLQSHNIS